MKHFVELARIRPRRIYLSDYIGRLLLHSKLHSIVLPNEWTSKQDLFLCTFPFESWTDLWTVDLYLADRAGLTKEICTIFQELRINILRQDLSIDSHEDRKPTGVIQMICDMRKYVNDGTVFERQGNPGTRLVNLIDDIAVAFWEILRWNRRQRQIHINRLRDLYNIGLRAEKIMRSEKANPPRPFVSEVDGNVASIGEVDWEAFARGFQADADGLFPVTITFDTVEHYIRVSALNPDKDYFVLEVPHRDVVGQIANFSSKLGDLKNDNKVEILCGCLRLLEAGANAIWRCLLKCEKDRSSAIKAEIVKAFKADEATRKITLKFPDPEREPRRGWWFR